MIEILNNIKPFVLIAYYLIVSVLIFQIIIDNKKPEKSFAYIFLLLLFPVGGIFLYFLLGVHYQKNKYYSRKRLYSSTLLDKKKVKKDPKLLLPPHKLPNLFYRNEEVSFTTENEIQFLVNGEEKFPELIKALQNAKKHIHIGYYIFNDTDVIGQKIINILYKKATEGVKIRIIYDDVGSSFSKKSIQKLQAHNIEIFPYLPVFFSKLAHKANYRNHRKIVIIDNEIGFVGGINISDKYINPNKFNLYWRDSHMLFKGEAVKDLQFIFISDWYFVSKKEISIHELQSTNTFTPTKPTPMCILSGEYGASNESIMEAFFSMITNANKEILITTPYFLPNESIFNALKITSKSGVKIKLIIPKHTDIKTAYFASQTYLKELLECGVEVYYYTKGMIHAKTMVIDGYICTIGSANFDYRSFNLNAEVNAFIVDKEAGAELKAQFNEDLKNTYLLKMTELKARKWYVKLTCSIARLFAPVL